MFQSKKKKFIALSTLWNAAILMIAAISATLIVCIIISGYRKSSDTEQDSPASVSNVVKSSQEEDGSLSEQIKKLESLGYVGTTEVSYNQVAVTIHDRPSAYQGLNFYTSAHGTEAILMDMDGAIVHKWSYPSAKLFSDYNRNKKFSDPHDSWARSELLANGEVLAIIDGWGLLKVDKNSNPLWVYRAGVHHKIWVEKKTGNIYTLTRKAAIYPFMHESEPVLNDFVCVLDPNGNETKKVSILGAIRNSPYVSLLKQMRASGDILHTNTIEVLDGRLANKIPAFRKGNILLSIREIDTVCVLDLEREAIVWAFSSLWHRQHDSTILDNGNMMVFDNKGTLPYSRIVEFNPVTQEVAWFYQGDVSNSFYSAGSSSASRLPNGNTLITETEGARAFEVTQDKRIVWKFVSPHKTGRRYNAAKLWDVIRIPLDYDMTWLKDAQDWRLRESPPAPGSTAEWFIRDEPFTPVVQWDFENNKAAQDWYTTPLPPYGGFTIENGLCHLNNAQYTMIINKNVQLDSDTMTRLRIRMRSTRGTRGFVFWSNSQVGPYPEWPFSYKTHFTPYFLISDGEFHEYTIELDRVPDWHGQWTHLSLQVAATGTKEDKMQGMEGATVEVDFIAFGTNRLP